MDAKITKYNQTTMHPVRAKKNLGQHFLRDKQIASRIADTIDHLSDMPILEVGPGTGMLTQYLLQRERELLVVEVDKESVAFLQNHFPTLNGRILEDDFLQMNFSEYFGEPFCVIGNYPYHISSQIFFKVLEHREQIPCCAGMIQKEVAERVVATPGNKAYSILSVLLQTWYDVEYLFTVNREAFIPPPKVTSAVVRLTRNKRRQLMCDEELFKKVVKATFNQRRKMLRNTLKPFLPNMEMLQDEPLLTKRPEELSVEQFEALTLRLTSAIAQAEHTTKQSKNK